jgi:hypothetical protein
MALLHWVTPTLATPLRQCECRRGFQTDPEALGRQVYGSVRDIATKLQSGVPCVIVDLPVDFSVDSLDGLFLANFRKVPKILFESGPRSFKLLYHRNAALDFVISSPVVSPCPVLPVCRV